MPEGHSIRHLANVFDERMVGTRIELSSPQGRFANEAALLTGRVLESTRAHGKHLFLRFGQDANIHIHLGLYGWLYFEHRADADEAKASIRLRMTTDDYIADLIGPTACALMTDAEVDNKCINLGPDPIHEDSDPELAWKKIKKSSRSIASLLMNQAVIAGIGNVYRAEVLFMTGTDPFIPGSQVTREKFDSIWSLSRELLRDGSKDGKIKTVAREHLTGDEVQWHGCAQYSYAYKRTGVPCRICSTKIEHDEIDGRVLYWCPSCQR
jgi:endonuclease-8